MTGVLQPQRPHLARVQEIARDYDDAGALWEALATRGVSPDAWVGDARRAFACIRCEGMGGRSFRHPEDGSHDWQACGTCALDCEACGATGNDADATGGACARCAGTGAYGDGTLPHPPSIAACVALASDPAGVTQAEALAREAVARLAAFEAPQPERIVWRVGAWDVRASCWSRAPRLMPRWRDLATKDTGTVASRWGEAYARVNGSRVMPIEPSATATLMWMRTWEAVWSVDRPNPWQPLCELFALGYALDAITDDALVLVCPALDGGDRG